VAATGFALRFLEQPIWEAAKLDQDMANAQLRNSGEARAGRPSKRTKETLARLYAAIADGMPINGACVVAGIGVQTLSDWRKRDPGIEDRLNEAYERARLKALSEIKLAGEKDWRAHKAWLELTRPGDYRASAKIDVTANAKVVSGNVLTVEDQRAR
jgi:hypothetical protein